MNDASHRIATSAVEPAVVWQTRTARARNAREAALRSVEAHLPRAVALARQAGCTEGWLTGSFARGTPSPESDVDLLVRDLAPEQRSDLVDALEHLFRRPVDLAEIERIAPERLGVALHGARRLFP